MADPDETRKAFEHFVKATSKYEWQVDTFNFFMTLILGFQFTWLLAKSFYLLHSNQPQKFADEGTISIIIAAMLIAFAKARYEILNTVCTDLMTEFKLGHIVQLIRKHTDHNYIYRHDRLAAIHKKVQRVSSKVWTVEVAVIAIATYQANMGVRIVEAYHAADRTIIHAFGDWIMQPIF